MFPKWHECQLVNHGFRNLQDWLFINKISPHEKLYLFYDKDAYDFILSVSCKNKKIYTYPMITSLPHFPSNVSCESDRQLRFRTQVTWRMPFTSQLRPSMPQAMVIWRMWVAQSMHCRMSMARSAWLAVAILTCCHPQHRLT